MERCVELVGNDFGEGGLSHSRRSPEDEGRYPSAVNHVAEYGPFAYKVALADILVERGRSQAFSKRLHVFSIKRCWILTKNIP